LTFFGAEIWQGESIALAGNTRTLDGWYAGSKVFVFNLAIGLARAMYDSERQAAGPKNSFEIAPAGLVYCVSISLQVKKLWHKKAALSGGFLVLGLGFVDGALTTCASAFRAERWSRRAGYFGKAAAEPPHSTEAQCDLATIRCGAARRLTAVMSEQKLLWEFRGEDVDFLDLWGSREKIAGFGH